MKAILLVLVAVVAAILIRARKNAQHQQPVTTGINVPATAQPVSTFPPSAAPPPWVLPNRIFPIGPIYAGILPITSVGGSGVSSNNIAPTPRPLPPQTITIAGISRPIYSPIPFGTKMVVEL